MVCVLEEGSALCIVWDVTPDSQSTKKTLTLPASTTIQELFKEVAKRYHYDPDTFELILQKTTTSEASVVLNKVKDKTLEEVGVNFEPGVRNNVIMTEIKGLPLKKMEAGNGEDDMLLGASASPTAGGDAITYSSPPFPVVSDYSYTAALIKHDTGYVGLVNQAMTCYLNSLLQALYMTPEFRNALYKWEFDGFEDDGIKSIPFQLQKLFLNLQTSSKPAVETTELTRSFGWDSSEAWQQHDIQELCRVMFDALEQKFKNTVQSDLISSLYEGKMIDYVKCLECSTEKTREDTFLDIPLPVRPFGSTVAYGSVEEALRAFVQPETLDGNNQYHCEKCNKKCDAHKGLKFSKFPYLLTLHLKRFDFDYSTLHRVKLNDKVVFPEILNLNSFIKTSREENENLQEETVVKNDDSSTTDSGSALDDESCQGTEPVLSTQEAEYQEDDEGIDVSNGPNHHENEKNRRHAMEKGPYMYELFSIMIHSGSASGGHYYAYIKDFRKGEWFCFNDQSVSRINYDDIRKTYGGGPMRGYYSGAYSSSTNAYMLMYRQIDKQRNTEAISVDEFPVHIKNLLQKMQEREERDRAAREKEMDMCKIKLYVHHPTQNQLLDTNFYCPNDMPLKEATELAYKQLDLEGIIPLEQCRLVNYDRLQDSIERSFEGCDDDLISEVFGSIRSNYKYDLLLEIRSKDKEFEVYQPGGVAAKVFVVDVETEEVDGPIMVRGNLSQTVKEFKQTLAKALDLNADTMKIMLEKYSNGPRLLVCDEKTLKLEGFYGSNKIFVASCSDEDSEKPVVITKLHKIIDRFDHIITLHMVLPDTGRETLEKLSIPSLDVDVNQNKGLDNLESKPSCSLPSCVNTSSTSISQPTADCTNTSESHTTVKSETTSDVQCSSELCSVVELKNSFETLYLVSESHNTSESQNVSESHSVLESQTTSPSHKDPSGSLKQALDQLPCDSLKVSSDPEDEGIGDAESVHDGNQGATGFSDQSASEDSSLTDSDRTLVGDVQDDCLAPFSSPSNSPPGSEDQNVSSPEETANKNVSKVYGLCAKEVKFQTKTLMAKEESENWDDDDESTQARDLTNFYFKAVRCVDQDSNQQLLKVLVDKRMLLGKLKSELEPYIGVPVEYFKIYRIYSGNQEFECARMTETLSSYRDEERLVIKLGRALRKGEHRGKVYQLLPNLQEPVKFLCDWIIAKGMTVGEVKKEVLEEIRKKYSVTIPENRCRLRKKSWKNPGKIYLDDQRFEDDIIIFSNWELFLQELPGYEVVRSRNDLVIFVRRWSPSTLKLHLFEEVVLENISIAELKKQLSERSGIPVENLEIAKGQSSFPCDMSILSVHLDLEWNAPVTSVEAWPLNIYEDGHVIFYRDKTEELKQLSNEERKEIVNKENSQFNRGSSTVSTFSPRKEKALKIYLDATPRTRDESEVD